MVIYTKYQLLWYKAVHLTIIVQLREKLDKIKDKTSLKASFLEWRISYNMYGSGDYAAALTRLEALCKMEDESGPLDTSIGTKSEKHKAVVLNNNSFLHQVAGRCSVQLFQTTHQHSYLESAYAHYENAINTMSANLFTMFKLPNLLLEFGQVLEFYGSFESALEVYARLITNFPNFRGYFEALYRTAIVTRHLAELMPVGEEKEEALNRCIDIFQFLLEALPTDISDVHCVLIYARTLEISSNPQLKYRSAAVYVTLFEVCRKHHIANARDFKSLKTWSDATINWFDLGEEIQKTGEFLIAKDAYNKFIDEKERAARFGVKLYSLLTLDICMTLAKRFAFYQNMTQAIRFAELAVLIDRYHSEARQLLAKWSKAHKAEFHKEKDAIQSIVSTWRGRCWTGGFVKRLKATVIADSETALTVNHRNMEARNQLAYYAKAKWRPHFLYEEHCAKVIQRWFREMKKKWLWQEIQYKNYEAKAMDMTRKFRKAPMDRDLRDDIKVLAQHRLCPRKNHPIVDIIYRITSEETAVWKIKRSVVSYFIRKSLGARVQVRVDIKNKVLREAATVIQSMVRMGIAHNKVSRQQQWKARRLHAAMTIQRFVRWRWKTMKHTVTVTVGKHRLEMLRRNRAMRTLKYLLPGRIKAYFIRKDMRIVKARNRRGALAAAETNSRLQALRLKAAIKIQTFYRTVFSNFFTKLSGKVISLRRQAHLSLSSSLLLHEAQHKDHTRYHPPGVRATSPAFAALMKQQTVLCGSHFSPADCLMLSLVLKHEYCFIKTLILDHVLDSRNPCYEFDLLPALNANKSLRSVLVLGGQYTPNFISGLFFTVQVENPRIVHLTVERHPDAAVAEAIGSAASRLLLDYFNYSIPGLVSLSLHSCSLRDPQMPSLAAGLLVNSSITELCLSCNLISDEGCVTLFSSITKNKKCRLKKLDLSYNLINCGKEVVVALDSYQHSDLKTYLTVFFINNIIYKRYFAADHLFKTNRTHLKVMYEYEEVEDSHAKLHHLGLLKKRSFHLHGVHHNYSTATKNNDFFKNAGRSIIKADDYLLKKRNKAAAAGAKGGVGLKKSNSLHASHQMNEGASVKSQDTSRSGFSESTGTFSSHTYY